MKPINKKIKRKSVVRKKAKQSALKKPAAKRAMEKKAPARIEKIAEPGVFAGAASGNGTADIAPQVRKKGSRTAWLRIIIALGAIALLVIFFPKIQMLINSTGEKQKLSSGVDQVIQKSPDETKDITPKFQSYKPGLNEKERYDYYIVKPKETLVTISVQLTGKYWNCKQLYEGNKNIIRDANIIFAGQTIRIPDAMKKQILMRHKAGL